MSSIKQKLFTLFPTHVVKYNLKEQWDGWEQVIDDLKYADTSSGGITDGNVQTSYEDDWKDRTAVLPIWQELDSLVLACVSQYCYLNSIEPVEVKDSWYTIMNKGSRVHRHRHECSVLSGTLFVNAPEGSHGLAFTNPTIPYRMYEKTNHSNASNEYAHLMEAEQGDLLIYPSWLEHFVPTIDCDNRITISFDTEFPLYGG